MSDDSNRIEKYDIEVALVEKASPASRFRQLTRSWEIIIRFLLVVLPIAILVWIFNIPQYFGKAVYNEQFYGLFLAIILVVGFLKVPITKKAPKKKLPWYDVIFSFLSLIGGGYVLLFYPEIALTQGLITPIRVILGGMVILFILEITRRLFGWTLVITSLLFICYARFTYLFPGAIGGKGLPLDRIVSFVYVDSVAIFGSVFTVIFGIVFSFILFGQGLWATGGGVLFTEAALAILGKVRGGAAKVSIIASSLFGSISGSATANVAVDGPITIPMMKRTGFRPHVAAAVEAVASTGGLIMPPIMGAGAFIMAEFLGIPYRDVAISAILPAIAYYFVFYIFVDLEAGKHGMKGLPADQVPSFKKVFIKGLIFLIPIAVLIYYLFIRGYSPTKSGLYAFATTLIVSTFRKESRLNLRKLLELLENTTWVMLDIGILSALIGIILGIFELTGLGLLLSQVLLMISRGNIYLLLVFTAVASIVLGMGMPAVPAYLFLAILAAPAIIKMGVPPLPAHLFVFYFSTLSFITPPVCPAIYVAATIGRTALFPTAFSAMRMAISAYIVPFIFVLSPAFILMGNVNDIVIVILRSMSGLVALMVAMQGYIFFFEKALTIPERILFLIGAVGLILNNSLGNIIAIGIIVFLLFWEWRKKRREN
jgi:TRAP transporter 4TM/12TM fusion protein